MIACLGWGSLIWNPETLPVDGIWHDDGPQLPIEFSRVSSCERLTLVITDSSPLVTVLCSTLRVPSLDDVINALAKREKDCKSQSIGLWSLDRFSRHEEVATIGKWATERNLTAVIWTALTPGIQKKRGNPLTCEEALSHLRGLWDVNRKKAEEYIRRAPTQIGTPYRAAIEEEFGWTPI